MQFSFSDEQDQFRAIIQRFLREKSPTTEVRRLMATERGYDSDVWRQLAEQLGLPAIHIPEVHGGSGFGPVELCIVMEEFGRYLLCAPYFASSVLATTAIMNGATAAEQAELLPPIASGERIATLAFTEPNGRWDATGVELTAELAGADYLLSGTKSFVLDGCSAELLIVVAREPGTSGSQGLSFFRVEPDAAGLVREQLQSMDATRKLARLTFTNTPGILLGELGNAAAALARTLSLAAIALANEMAGGAQALLDSAVSYAKMRVQFGRTIGSFQAIKHKCADMLLEVESAKSAAYYAAQAAADNDSDLPALASLAKACASDAYMNTAANCIQIHGGIGFTWENDTHLWFKRAKSSEAFLGDPSYHRELLMQNREL
jgi:alkylation response protein AidB-like acyl-CoA dehydrogenase